MIDQVSYINIESLSDSKSSSRASYSGDDLDALNAKVTYRGYCDTREVRSRRRARLTVRPPVKMGAPEIVNAFTKIITAAARAIERASAK